MTGDRWNEVERLYQACVDREPSERVRFLDEACSDEEVRQEVESLLSHRGKEPSFVDQALPDVLAGMAAGNSGKVRIGQTIGHYRISSFIDSGGMGEVYRARDTKLDRDVAIKMLPDEFTQDSER